MATDPSLPGRPRPERAHDASTLAADVHHRSRAVIESELRRLTGRTGLRREDFDIIDAALDDLVEALFLARLRRTPQHTAQLAQLFGVPTDVRPPPV